MSKKNNLAKRKKQHEFDLQSTTDRSYIRLLPCRFSSHLLVDFTNQASDLGLWWLSCMCVCAGEKEAKEKLAKKLQAKKSKMKIDGDVKRKGGKFKVGKKKVKTKLSALTKAKAAQAMEVDK
uniref:Uncharacterized protein n=1 Tax=Oryza glaberrima TaxID=4538 RepID=I1P5Q9_ORYGL